MNQTDLISAALVEIGVLSPGEALTAQDEQSASTVLSQMLDAWQAQSMYIFATARLVFSPVALKQVYTIGPGGDFNVPRPAKIQGFGIINLQNPIQPAELPVDELTAAQWRDVVVKNIPSALPQKVWDDQQFPLRNLSYWPVPNIPVEFSIYCDVQLNSWPDYVTDVTFPPGYFEAIRYALAIRLAPSFGAAAMVTPQLLQLAKDAQEVVKIANVRIADLRCDDAIVRTDGGVYDWRTDTQIGNG